MKTYKILSGTFVDTSTGKVSNVGDEIELEDDIAANHGASIQLVQPAAASAASTDTHE